MTLNEFSDSFDVLWNNIASNQAPGLNAYDKSVVLTKAEKEIIKNYFIPQSNQKQTGFDGSPKRQSDFAALMKNVVLTVNNTATKFDARSTAYDMPDDLFITINEQITSNASGINSIYTVLPITFDEYGKLMQKPYKYPTKNTAWKLMTSENTLLDLYNDKNEYQENQEIKDLFKELKTKNEKIIAGVSYFNNYTSQLNSYIRKIPQNIVALISHTKQSPFFDGKERH